MWHRQNRVSRLVKKTDYNEIKHLILVVQLKKKKDYDTKTTESEKKLIDHN